ncbi:polysaccharide export protein [Stutzerimonas degradans]|nr:polysaccharide export protein [Stutzerimonas degradans]EKM94468.1 polysaccharide export protein [Stutzerimonas degradans]
MVAPFSSAFAAVVASFFVEGEFVFAYVFGLCFSQVLFFFLGSVFQAAYLVKEQLGGVLIQAACQLLVIYFAFHFIGADFRFALLASMLGYFFATCYLGSIIGLRYGLERPFRFSERFYSNLKLKYEYGIALVPWTLGILVMSGAERFAIGFYGIEYGDAYLSLKDLFVGAGGLLSMPILMVVHSVVVDKFRSGSFDSNVIEASVGVLVYMFASLWSVIYFVGFDFFERMTGKDVGIPTLAAFISFFSVSLACISVYLQKRLEVHKRIKYLAFFALVSALIAVVFSFWLGGHYGIYGVALGGGAAQLVYYLIVSQSVFKKISFFRCIGKPLLLSGLIFIWGYIVNICLVDFFYFLDWRIRSVSWVVGFLVVFGILFWRAGEWRAFLLKL